jgi:LuxR family maltose regulon positive regulatory protein
MSFASLQAKLHRTAPTPSVIARPYLLRQLNEGLAHKVTLVSAPAGFGKSTLVSAWIDTLVTAKPTPTAPPMVKASWLNLDEADNQLPHFLNYLVAAIHESFPHSCEAVTHLLQEKPLPTVEALADTLAGGLTTLSGKFVLVLDDLHVVDDPAIYAFLTRLVQRAPPHFHLVLITRVDPPLPLNRWRARGEINEFRLYDLCFTVEETTTFLCSHLDSPPTTEVVAKLHELTEGWVVGLRLVALALRGESDYGAFVASFEANSNRYIVDYLVDDVLDDQPPAVQEFLICTAILKRFNAGLCAAVVEIDKNTAQQHISHIERENLFLVELGAEGGWYRYHHQFQNMLLSRLHERYDQQAIAALHRQAAGWLAARGQVSEALRHLTAIPDLAAAADLIERERNAALNEQRFSELEEWLAVIPERLLSQRPHLLITLAWVQHHRLENVRCIVTVQRAADRLHEEALSITAIERYLLEAEILAIYLSLDCELDQAETLPLIRLVWAQIKDVVALTHSNVVAWLILISQRLGDLDLAVEIAHTASEAAVEWPQTARCRLLYTSGVVYWYDCKPAQAERIFQKGLQLARQHSLPLSAALCQFGLAAIASAHNQQQLAETLHLAVVNAGYFQSGLRTVLSIYHLIRIYAGQGQPEKALGLVERLKAHATLLGRPYLQEQVAALAAYLSLQCGDLDVALRWALAKSPNGLYNSEDRIPVIRAQILLAEGSSSSLAAAHETLQELAHRHQSEHCGPLLTEVLILQALVWSKMGEVESALDALGRAVQLAVPNGLFGPFVEERSSLERLLHLLGKRPEHAPLVQLMQAAFPSDRTPPVTVATHEMPESLTERELDILHLLAARLSNKEIAQQLIVSPHTVRNHTVNIFGKLQVENRMQAVERARSLGLLPDVNGR